MKILKDKYLRIVFAISFFLFLITTLFLFAKFFPKSGPFIIHYDIFKGIDWVGDRIEIIGIALVNAALLAINAFLAEFIYSKERFLSYLFSYTALVLNILFLIAAISISLAN